MAKPTHRLMVKKKGSDLPAHEVGVGWLNQGEYGQYISLTLKPCIDLNWRDDVYITLTRINYKDQAQQDDQPEEDDIPF